MDLSGTTKVAKKGISLINIDCHKPFTTPPSEIRTLIKYFPRKQSKTFQWQATTPVPKARYT